MVLLGKIVKAIAVAPEGILRTIDTLIERLLGKDGDVWLVELKKFLRKESTWVQPLWINSKETVEFTLVSNGRTGAEWITHFKQKGVHVIDRVQSLLLSNDFKPTKDIITRVVVLKSSLFSNKDRYTRYVRGYARNAVSPKLCSPNAEVACLIRDIFTDANLQAMGLQYIIIMHEPIQDSEDELSLLVVSYFDGLYALSNELKDNWDKSINFAFTVSQETV